MRLFPPYFGMNTHLGVLDRAVTLIGAGMAAASGPAGHLSRIVR